MDLVVVRMDHQTLPMENEIASAPLSSEMRGWLQPFDPTFRNVVRSSEYLIKHCLTVMAVNFDQ